MKSATAMLLNKTQNEIWRRGESYADKKLVEIINSDENEIRSTVKGTQNYKVDLKFAPRGISQQCDCPYFRKNGYICKHIVAVAIIWDKERGIPCPDQNAVERNAVPPPALSRREINYIFRNPIKADHDHLRILPEVTAMSGYIRSHSKLPEQPKISTNQNHALTLKEIQRCFSEIKRWSQRKSYDPYFCSGEMVAAFCQTLKIIKDRISVTSPLISAEILLSVQEFHSLLVTELIDDSQGLHEFSEVYLEEIYRHLKSQPVSNQDSKNYEKLLLQFKDRRGEY